MKPQKIIIFLKSNLFGRILLIFYVIVSLFYFQSCVSQAHICKEPSLSQLSFTDVRAVYTSHGNCLNKSEYHHILSIIDNARWLTFFFSLPTVMHTLFLFSFVASAAYRYYIIFDNYQRTYGSQQLRSDFIEREPLDFDLSLTHSLSVCVCLNLHSICFPGNSVCMLGIFKQSHYRTTLHKFLLFCKIFFILRVLFSSSFLISSGICQCE